MERARITPRPFWFHDASPKRFLSGIFVAVSIFLCGEFDEIMELNFWNPFLTMMHMWNFSAKLIAIFSGGFR